MQVIGGFEVFDGGDGIVLVLYCQVEVGIDVFIVDQYGIGIVLIVVVVFFGFGQFQMFVQGIEQCGLGVEFKFLLFVVDGEGYCVDDWWFGWWGCCQFGGE